MRNCMKTTEHTNMGKKNNFNVFLNKVSVCSFVDEIVVLKKIISVRQHYR